MSERVYQWTAASIVLLITILSLVPLWYVINGSLVNEQEWMEKGGFILWPEKPTLMAYERLLAGTAFTQALFVSMIRTVLGTALTLSMTTILAYAVSRKSLPGRKALLFAVLVTILFGGGLIPSYLVVRDLQMLNTIWALIIPSMVDSWSVLVLKQFFENLPEEMEESAKIDGAGEGRLMWAIMIPMAAPAMAAIGLFTAVGHWNSWFDSLIYIDNAQLHPLQLLIRNMFTNASLSVQQNLGQASYAMNAHNRVSIETLKMALVVFGTIPILCVYPFLQKHFTKGMYLGAVKG
ncbi:hypothetical protein PAT3040_00333 [Paenibacillus agaridevorans]|uniref:ABC transmembrane type-1 domain-containing protein n=1 Tax=Paenibacillus agaridevorans TaxID=171404 RepID=A0A2R5ELK6_9BACL|nr:carbohydrate ABC transporter permease [Paenibacillus agaridevorans]GBG05848.1 hypothetical protein PAT3040_00333 [Paenibacillus agaridevorans]